MCGYEQKKLFQICPLFISICLDKIGRKCLPQLDLYLHCYRQLLKEVLRWANGSKAASEMVTLQKSPIPECHSNKKFKKVTSRFG